MRLPDQAMEEEDGVSKPDVETQTMKEDVYEHMLQKRKSTIIHGKPAATKATIGYNGSDQAMEEEDGVSYPTAETQTIKKMFMSKCSRKEKA